WGLVMRKLVPEHFTRLWAVKNFRAPLLFLRLVRAGLAVLYIGLVLLNFFSVYVAGVGFVLLIGLSIIFSKRIHEFYLHIENRFFYSFHDRERQEAISSRRELAPWDARIAHFTVPIGSPYTGKTLEELALREKIGVNITMIKRGEYYTIAAPGRVERLY